MLKNKKTSKWSLLLLLLWTTYLGLRISDLGGLRAETNNGTRMLNKAEISQNINKKITIREGKASFYDYYLEKHDWSSKGHFVCATRDFERYSYVEVTNLANGFMVKCYVTDYGPDESIHPDRVIDLSSTAFKTLAPLDLGVINVKVKQL